MKLTQRYFNVQNLSSHCSINRDNNIVINIVYCYLYCSISSLKTYRVFMKYCGFFLKMFWSFWTLSVMSVINLPSRLVYTHWQRGQWKSSKITVGTKRLEYNLIPWKNAIFNETLYVNLRSLFHTKILFYKCIFFNFLFTLIF